MRLSIRKHHLLNAIDKAAGNARCRYFTDLPGQSALYVIKLRQASDFLAGIVAGVATRPPGAYIAAEAGARGITPRAMAQLVVDAAEAWDGAKGPAIEAARVRGRLAVASAATPEAAESAMLAAVAELNAL